MPYKINIEPQGSYVICTGHYDLKQIHQSNGEVMGLAEFDSHKYQIWNLLDADMFDIDINDMREPAAMDTVAGRTCSFRQGSTYSD